MYWVLLILIGTLRIYVLVKRVLLTTLGFSTILLTKISLFLKVSIILGILIILL